MWPTYQPASLYLSALPWEAAAGKFIYPGSWRRRCWCIYLSFSHLESRVFKTRKKSDWVDIPLCILSFFLSVTNKDTFFIHVEIPLHQGVWFGTAKRRASIQSVGQASCCWCCSWREKCMHVCVCVDSHLQRNDTKAAAVTPRVTPRSPQRRKERKGSPGKREREFQGSSRVSVYKWHFIYHEESVENLVGSFAFSSSIYPEANKKSKKKERNGDLSL